MFIKFFSASKREKFTGKRRGTESQGTGERKTEDGRRKNGGRETGKRIASSARDACLLAMTRGLRNDMGLCIVSKHPFLSLRGGPIHRADAAIRNPNPSTPQGLSCRQTSCRYIVLQTMGYMALRPGDISSCGRCDICSLRSHEEVSRKPAIFSRPEGAYMALRPGDISSCGRCDI